jgi:cytochrome o ubiquinol oxidase subunit II
MGSKLNKKPKLISAVLLLLVMTLVAIVYFHSHSVVVLSPQGVIASKERSLIITASLLMAIVVIPVFILTTFVAWKYQETNTKAKYRPDWDHNSVLEFFWWAIPGVIILILAVITWNSSHELDPFKAIVSNKKPLTVQVVALQWKWLFIYPEQGIASVNILQIPQQTPINFEVTADAPMNSFWIPQLGGQVYAMPGMSTQLHLMASTIGTYRGSSANISGRGFAGMDFTARSTSQAGFDNWVKLVKRSNSKLSLSAYNNLAKPSQNDSLAYYSSSQKDLYDRVVNKFLYPASQLPYITGHSSHGGGL